MEKFLMCGSDKVCNNTCKRCEQCMHSAQTDIKCMDTRFQCSNCIISNGIERIKNYCQTTTSNNPVEIALQLLKTPAIPEHGVIYHFVVGASLLTAYKNCGGQINLPQMLGLVIDCGKRLVVSEHTIWHNLGLGISAGIYVNLVTQVMPFSSDNRKLSSLMTSRYLGILARDGAPACCKAETLIAIKEAAQFTRQIFEQEMELPKKLECALYKQECITGDCRFLPLNAVIVDDDKSAVHGKKPELKSLKHSGPLS